MAAITFVRLDISDAADGDDHKTVDVDFAVDFAAEDVGRTFMVTVKLMGKEIGQFWNSGHSKEYTPEDGPVGSEETLYTFRFGPKLPPQPLPDGTWLPPKPRQPYIVLKPTKPGVWSPGKSGGPGFIKWWQASAQVDDTTLNEDKGVDWLEIDILPDVPGHQPSRFPRPAGDEIFARVSLSTRSRPTLRKDSELFFLRIA